MIIHVRDEGVGFKLSDVPDPLCRGKSADTFGPRNFSDAAFMDEFDVVSGKTGGAEIVMSRSCPPREANSPNGQGGQQRHAATRA